MPSYRIVNPRIGGEFNDTVTAESAPIAAQKIWTSLSKYITNNVPRFVFTLQETGKNGKYHHFQVTESPQGRLANYTIKNLDPNLVSKDQINLFRSEANRLDRKFDVVGANVYTDSGSTKVGMVGGRHRSCSRRRRMSISLLNDNDDEDDDEDDDDDDDDDDNDPESELFYKRIRSLNKPQPIVYWWYSPQLYSNYNLSSVYIPTFNPPLLPYVEVSLSSAWLG